MEDRCVVCGEVIPEGRQVCILCELAESPSPCMECTERSEGCHVYCKAYSSYYIARERLRGVKLRQNERDEYFVKKAKRKKYFGLGKKTEYTEGNNDR